MQRWFVVGKHEAGCRLRSVHERDGSLVYDREPSGPPEFWWVFLELSPGMETPEGPLAEGQTCCMMYPYQDKHVLACVYSHRPWVGYPRFWQIPPDDLPFEVREAGCWYGNDQRLFFPSYDKLPSTMRPIYAALCVSAPGGVKLDELMDVVVNEANQREIGLKEGGPFSVPGGI